MISFLVNNNKEMCSGCRACEQICPVDAIEVLADNEGFIYPEIDMEKCIECGLCVKTCPYTSNNREQKKNLFPQVYAIANKDKYILEQSSSGGVFSAVANFVNSKSGYIASCIFDDSFNAIHVIANDKETLSKMRGSKYVQSDTMNTYTETKRLLEDDNWVLYSGTPCQIAGLKSYIMRDYQKLITIDLICHGTPSNLFFKTYLKWQESKIEGKIVGFKFRDKLRNKWAASGSYDYIKHGKKRTKRISAYNNYYYNYYMSGQAYRECCYTCQYATIKREGDFTIGDFWGVEKYHEEFYPPEGVSVVLVNTNKGQEIFEQIKRDLKIVPSKIKFALEGNGNLSKPSERPFSRNTIYKDLRNHGFETIAQRDCSLSVVMPFIKRSIPYKLKAAIKKVINKI